MIAAFFSFIFGIFIGRASVLLARSIRVRNDPDALEVILSRHVLPLVVAFLIYTTILMQLGALRQ